MSTQFFANEGCSMVEMTCEEHDEAAASTQFITHTVGRMLATMNLKSTRINTKGFDALLNLISQTNSDSFELYYGLFLYNQNATDELERLEQVRPPRAVTLEADSYLGGHQNAI